MPPRLADGWEELWLTVNGLRLHAVQAGPADGRLVILLHGFPEFWYGWRHQIGPLAAAGLRVVALDQRGYNLSDKPARVADYALELLAADVVGLLDALGCERAALVGHDWGAAVAWWVALRAPARVERLAILNVPHPVVMQRALRSNWQQLRRSWYVFAFQMPRIPELLLARKHWQPLTVSLRKSSRPGTFSDVELACYREAWSQPGAMRAMVDWYRAAVRVRPERLSDVRVRVPTQILWGAQDPFLGRELAEASSALCEHGRLEFFEQATHWVQHEEAAAVTGRLSEFLAG